MVRIVQLILFTCACISMGCNKQKEIQGNGLTMCSNETRNDQGRPASIKGTSYESPSNPVGTETFDSMDSTNVNYTAIIPFGFIANGSSTVQYNIGWQWWGERDAGVIALTEYAHEHNIKVMIKPQVWISGNFTGDYTVNSETEWQELEDSYRNYILHFADLADSLNADLFCIGTEWKKFVVNRPQFWSQLIDSTRAHFSGLLTYAGNWDAYDDFPHWNKLDFIGIDAYFPISNKTTPTVQECKDGWAPHFNAIKSLHKQIGKPVIFTEYGYRSVDQCGDQPWDSSSGGNLNLKAQSNAYEALYEVFWNENWFEGGFLWKWKAIHSTAGGLNNNRFTPQNKPAQAIVKHWYGKR